MSDDRNDRDYGRDNSWDNLGYRGTGSSYDNSRSQSSQNNRRDYGNNDGWRTRDSVRDDNRRDYGGGNFFGSNRDDYGSRSSYGADRGYGNRDDRGSSAGNRGGYDEWSRGGSRSFGDRYSTSEGYGGFYGGNDRDFRDRDYGNQNRWSSGGQSYGGGERGYSQGGRGFWDKASDEVSSWFGDRDAEQRRENDQHRGRGPKNYTRSDDRIRDDVNDRLTDDGWLDASNVDVSVKDREVTLSGTVSDRNAKRRAEDVAEGVSGVSHVQNNLRIKSNDATLSDTDVDVDRGGTAGMVAKSSAGGQR